MVDKAATVVTTEYGTASNPINNCSGTVYPGNPGTIDPEDPQNQIQETTPFTPMHLKTNGLPMETLI